MAADVLVVGSGMGGAGPASGRVPTAPRALMVERGERLADGPEARDPAAIFGRAHDRPAEARTDAQDRRFNPGDSACVGGKSAFCGAALMRCRETDFRPRRHRGGTPPGWPVTDAGLEPFHTEAERLFAERGDAAADPAGPPHSAPCPFPPVPDEPEAPGCARRWRRCCRPRPVPTIRPGLPSAPARRGATS